MSYWQANLPDLVIASGATATTTPITASLDDARCVSVFAPAALTGVVTVQVSNDGGTTWFDLQDGTGAGSDVTIGVGNVRRLDWCGWNGLRVTSGSAEGAERTFKVNKQFMVTA